jgi:hypothetical protein
MWFRDHLGEEIEREWYEKKGKPQRSGMIRSVEMRWDKMNWDEVSWGDYSDFKGHTITHHAHLKAQALLHSNHHPKQPHMSMITWHAIRLGTIYNEIK